MTAWRIASRKDLLNEAPRHLHVMSQSTIPTYITSLTRHFEDLRDGTHGGSARRKDKESHFDKAVQLLPPIARQVLNQMNINLRCDTAQLIEPGLPPTPDRGLYPRRALS